MQTVEQQIIKTYNAAIHLRAATDKQVKAVLVSLAEAIEASAKTILTANAKDLAKQDPANERNDRLMLNETRIKNIASSIRNISKLPNPSGKLLEQKKLPNGLQLSKVSVPLGVVGAIYESRPNVTYDIAALCLRSQNGCVLKAAAKLYTAMKPRLPS